MQFRQFLNQSVLDGIPNSVSLHELGVVLDKDSHLLLNQPFFLQSFAFGLAENLLRPDFGLLIFLKCQFSLAQCFLQRLIRRTYLFSEALSILKLLLNLALMLLLADLVLLLLLLVTSVLELQLPLDPGFFLFLAFLQLALLPLQSLKAGLFFEFSDKIRRPLLLVFGAQLAHPVAGRFLRGSLWVGHATGPATHACSSVLFSKWRDLRVRNEVKKNRYSHFLSLICPGLRLCWASQPHVQSSVLLLS